eukprot:1027_1
MTIALTLIVGMTIVVALEQDPLGLDCNYTLIDAYAVPTDVCLHNDQLEVEMYLCIDGYLFYSYWNASNTCDDNITPNVFKNVSAEFSFNCHSQNQCDYLCLEQYNIDENTTCTDGTLPANAILWKSTAAITNVCIKGVITTSCESLQSTTTIYSDATCTGLILDQVVVNIGGNCEPPNQFVRDSQCIQTSEPTTPMPSIMIPTTSIPTTTGPTIMEPTTDTPSISLSTSTVFSTTSDNGEPTSQPTLDPLSTSIDTTNVEASTPQPTLDPLSTTTAEPTPVPTQINATSYDPSYEPSSYPTITWETGNKGKAKTTNSYVIGIIQNNKEGDRDTSNSTSEITMYFNINGMENNDQSAQVFSTLLYVSLLLIVAVLSLLAGLWIGMCCFKQYNHVTSGEIISDESDI